MKQYSALTRVLAVVMAAAMVLSLFAGCQTDRGLTNTTDPTADGLTISGSDVLGQLKEEQKLRSRVDRGPGDGTAKDYTIMVYMVGSNLESEYGCASSDILEMLNSGLDASKANLVIYTGGSKSWELSVPSDTNTVWALSADGSTLEQVAATGQPANMGDAATFLDFLSYAYSNYPADHYGLICWDHGGGPMYGYGNDELFGYDCLYLEEMDAAMAASPFAQQKLDFIGFDACLMASVEVANVFSQYAYYMIASEEVEDGNGWDYSFLNVLNTTTDTLTIAQRALSTYQTAMENTYWKPEYTLSCIDLMMFPTVLLSLANLSNQMKGDVEDGNYSQIARCRDASKRFGMGAVSDRGSSLDLVDLGNMAENLGEEYAENVQTLQDYLGQTVKYQVSNVEGTTGLSIYYPYDNKDQYRNGGDTIYDTTGLLWNYQSFLTAFAGHWLDGQTGIRWLPNQTIETEEKYLKLQLEDEQLEHLGSVTYSILQYDEAADAYCPIMTDFKVQPDKNGVILIPRDPDVFLMHTDIQQAGEKGTLWPVTLVESGKEKNNYVSTNSCLLTSREVIVGGTQAIQISLADELGTGEVVIQSILSTDQSDMDFYGKMDVSIENWGVIAYNWVPLFPTYDTEGVMLPWKQWETDGSYWYTYCNYEDSFHLEKGKLSDLEGVYYCQVVMEDSCGNIIGTRFEELYTNVPYEEQQLSLAEGTMTFRVYEDHAELTGFDVVKDTDTFTYQEYAITIPDTVDGVPVTVIGPEVFKGCLDIKSVTLPGTLEEIRYNAFSSCYYLEQVTLPESLKIIGDVAFGWTDIQEIQLPAGLKGLGYQSFTGTELTRVELPAGLEQMGAGVFSYCHALEEITVAEGNSAYKSVDGVLFTADGTKLLAYPEAAGASYQVPDGVLVIAGEAFRGNDTLTSVTFPEGLLVIDRLAFCDTFGLQTINLPDSLETIGSAAFGNSSYKDPAVAVEPLVIGTNVSWIGSDAFAAYNIKAFDVAEDNEYYASANGCLLNKSGTRLLQAPYGLEGKLVIPDGVSYIDWQALDACDFITELVIPDSVVSVDRGAGAPANLEKLTVGKGMTAWGNVKDFFHVAQIVISEDNPNYAMYEGSVYSKDKTVLYLCRAAQEHFAIPEGVTAIAKNAFQQDYRAETVVKSIYIPGTVETIPEGVFCNLHDLENLEVAENNPNFATYDGILYSKDGKILLACPLAKTGTVQVREGTVEIGTYAFYYGSNLQANTIILPEGVKIVRYGNFISVPYSLEAPVKLYLPDSLTDIHPDMLKYVAADEMVIYCSEGSAAETFAESWGIPVVNE